MTINKVRDTFDTVRDCITFNLWDVLSDGVDDDGDAVITDSDTLDDLIDIIGILARMESRRVLELKSENESIL